MSKTVEELRSALRFNRFAQATIWAIVLMLLLW